MKKKILKLSLVFLFAAGLCTATSIRVEEVLIPQVSVVKANYQDDFMKTANVPSACLAVLEPFGKGVWSVSEYESIWGGIEYQAVFVPDCILEEHEDYLVIENCPSLVIQDTLKPLEEGEKVRLIE